MRVKALLLAVIIISGLGGKVQAQLLPPYGNTRAGTTGLQFLKVIPDARSAGMGGAFHAVVNDPSALYWNPAGAMYSDSLHYQIGLTHSAYFAGINMDYGTVLWRPSARRAWGLQVMNLRSPEMPVTTEWMPFGTGQTFYVNDLILGLTYAQILSEKFAFGVTAKYAYEGIATVQTHNVLFDLGLQYRIGWKDIRFSVGLQNFGFNVNPNGSIQLLTLGGMDTIRDFDEVSVPALFRIGIAKEFILSDQHHITASAQLNHPTDNRESIAIGAEYGYRKYLFVRTGYEFGVGQGAFPAVGFGVQLPRRFGALRFDYAFNHMKLLGASHRIGLGIGLSPLNKQ